MNRFRNILGVVSAAQKDDAMIERAVALAEHNQARLTLMSVVPPVTSSLPAENIGADSAELEAWLMTEAQQHLSTLTAPYGQRLDIQSQVTSGTLFIEVIRRVLQEGCDLVIKTPEEPGWLDRLLGSDDLHLLRKCPCPVWMIKPRSSGGFNRIVAAVDVDEGYSPDELEGRRALNRQVMELATSLALSEFAELHVVHAWEAIGEGAMRNGFMMTEEGKVQTYVEAVERHHKRSVDTLIRDTIDRLGPEASAYLKPNAHLLKGWARKEIPALIDELEADLVVMGTVGRTGIRGLLMGNTAEMILTQINCSVLATKPPGFVSPVEAES